MCGEMLYVEMMRCGEMMCDVVYKWQEYSLPMIVASYEGKPTLYSFCNAFYLFLRAKPVFTQ